MKVIIGLDSSLDLDSNSQTLFQFIYRQHQDFGLEANATETILHPRDEQTLFQLVLSEASKKEIIISEDIKDKCWRDVCEFRLGCSDTNSASIESLAKITTVLLRTYNVVDRVLISKRVLEEFESNNAVKEVFYSAEYVITSRVLPWFEYTALKHLVLFNVPHLDFTFSNSPQSHFCSFRQCCMNTSLRYKKCPVKDVFLGYLGLSVNIKDSIRLLRCLNRPKRGLNLDSFTALRHVADEDKISAGQAAVSFVGRRQLGGSFYAPDSSHPLNPWCTGLQHLVECLNKCQDALAGDEDDRLLVMSSQDNHMGLDDAYKAVDSCLSTINHFLRKPLVGTTSSDTDSLDDSYFSETEIKLTLSNLRARLKQLMSSPYVASLCGETPGRLPVNGGSLLGRAARKLVRLLLVVEAEASIVLGYSESNPTTPLDANTPTRLPPTGTPVTASHDERVIRMFKSPSAPLSCTPTSQHMQPEIREEETDSLLTEGLMDKAVSLPAHPVFSRYQTNLDWADSQCSPIAVWRHESGRSSFNTDDIHTCSLPAWTERRPKTGEVAAYSVNSNPTTPTKRTRSPMKVSRTLFSESGETVPQNSSVASKRKSEPTRKAPLAKMNRCRRATVASSSRGQRQITDFFAV